MTDDPRQPEIDQICEHLKQWLQNADIDTIRVVRYAFMGLSQSTLRDLRWTVGRKAGRILCQMAEG